MLIHTFIILILATGWLLRHRRAYHIPLMGLGFVLDFGLVLLPQLTLLTEQATLSLLSYFHAFLLLLMSLLYAWQLSSGLTLIINPAQRSRHRLLAGPFFTARALVFASSLTL